MKRTIYIILAVAVLAAYGCGGGGESAVDVADNFWNAMEDRDVETARKYATAASAEGLTIDEDAGDQDGEVELGEPTEEDGKVVIPTKVTAMQEDGSSMTVAMQTILVKEDGEWRVDVDATMFSMFGGAMGQMMEEMGKAMAEGMEEMGKAMAEGMEQTAEELSKSLEDGQ